MNITTQPVSFLPTSAAQPTDTLRRDNTTREVISPLNANEAFNRERGLGADSERRPLSQERSYAQQLAEARIESGFPGFLKPIEERQQGDQQGNQQGNQPQSESARAAVERDDRAQQTDNRFANLSAEWGAEQATMAWRDSNGAYQTGYSTSLSPTTLNQSDTMGATAVDPDIVARGQRIEQFYEGSFRPKERFLLGVA